MRRFWIMDNKEQQIMKHYKMLIETNTFDEYDILGFLIFIRRHLSDDKHPNIKEFAHLIAHRERDRGKVNNCIVTAILPKYKTDKLHELLYKFSLNETIKQGCIPYEDMQFGEQAKNNGNFTAIDIGYEIVKYTRLIEF